MPFDRTRDYATVCGVPGVAYEQNGKNYGPHGQLLERLPNGTWTGAKEDAADPVADSGVTARRSGEGVEGPADYRHMSNDKLRVALGIYGLGDWKGRSEAIAALEGRA